VFKDLERSGGEMLGRMRDSVP